MEIKAGQVGWFYNYEDQDADEYKFGMLKEIKIGVKNYKRDVDCETYMYFLPFNDNNLDDWNLVSKEKYEALEQRLKEAEEVIEKCNHCEYCKYNHYDCGKRCVSNGNKAVKEYLLLNGKIKDEYLEDYEWLKEIKNKYKGDK